MGKVLSSASSGGSTWGGFLPQAETDMMQSNIMPVRIILVRRNFLSSAIGDDATQLIHAFIHTCADSFQSLVVAFGKGFSDITNIGKAFVERHFADFCLLDNFFFGRWTGDHCTHALSRFFNGLFVQFALTTI